MNGKTLMQINTELGAKPTYLRHLQLKCKQQNIGNKFGPVCVLDAAAERKLLAVLREERRPSWHACPEL